MRIIYEPKGRAKEYSPLAANLYRGCSHGCDYCFAPLVIKMKKEIFTKQPQPRRGILKALEKDAMRFRGDKREILLSFTSDPYQHLEMDLGITRQAIEILMANDLRFTILTKGGVRATRDFDLLKTYNKCRFGSTIIFTEQRDADRWETNAPPISERIEVIKLAREKGIKTWVSLEPVIDPFQALELIKTLHPFVDEWKVGKLNYKQPDREVDWIKFRETVKELLESIGANYYIKKSLTQLTV